MKRNETTKFEFLFTLESNIICQRFFNVKGFNPEVRRSLDLYHVIKNIAEDIQSDLRARSIDFLYENEKYFSTISDPAIAPDNENFLIQIKLGDEIILSRQFSANVYPPKVRYTVDIRPEMRNILAEISDVLSQAEFETTYLQTVL